MAGLQLMRPASWLPYVFTAGVSALATGFAPRFWGPAVTPAWAYGTQAAVAIAGGMVLPMVLGKAHGLVWFLVGFGIIAADMIARYVLPMTGLAAYPYQSHAALTGIGQQPYYPPTLSAYPELGAYPHLSAYENTPLAPFDGVPGRVGAYWSQ